MFCDLVGSTALSARLDPEDLRELIGTYHRCIADTVSLPLGIPAGVLGEMEVGKLCVSSYPC
jgi:hypothetical protein